MSKKIKYTSDGKKVVVIGQLNATSTIVQEVFVVGNKEKPSGEHFVVTSLHDAPAESWKEKNLKQIELNYANKSAEYEKRLKDLERQYEGQKCILSEKITAAAEMIKSVSPKDFQRIYNFLTGKITHIIVGTLYSPEILTMQEFEEKYLLQRDSWSAHGLRLISIYGYSKGKLDFNMNNWRDGSGSDQIIVPFTSYQEAHAEIENILLKNEVYDANTIRCAKKYGIKLDPKKIKAYKESKIKEIDRMITRAQEEMASLSDTKREVKKIK